MSRSTRHSPFCGITTKETEHDWKAQTSKAWRRAVKVALYRIEPDSSVLPLRYDVRSQWGPKDGKQRFDVSVHPELMRK